MQQNRRQPAHAELRELVAIGRLLAFRLNLIAEQRDRVEGIDVARLERQLSLAWQDALERFRRRDQPSDRGAHEGRRLPETSPSATAPGTTGTRRHGEPGRTVVNWLAADSGAKGNS